MRQGSRQPRLNARPQTACSKPMRDPAADRQRPGRAAGTPSPGPKPSRCTPGVTDFLQSESRCSVALDGRRRGGRPLIRCRPSRSLSGSSHRSKRADALIDRNPGVVHTLGTPRIALSPGAPIHGHPTVTGHPLGAELERIVAIGKNRCRGLLAMHQPSNQHEWNQHSCIHDYSLSAMTQHCTATGQHRPAAVQ